MSNTTNPFTEIAAIVLTGLFILVGGLLLYASKITFEQASIIFGLAVAIYTGKILAQAPSPTQQAQIATIASQQSEVISQLASQAAATPAPQPTQAGMTMQEAEQAMRAAVYTQPAQQQPQYQPEQPVTMRQIPPQFVNMPASQYGPTMPYPVVGPQ